VVVFVDPRCPHCRALLNQLPALAGRYRFRLVPLPILGSDSEAEVLRLACAAERDPTVAREALLAGTAGALPSPPGPAGRPAPSARW
jgi:thiol:disulfide interchange protein DsbC